MSHRPWLLPSFMLLVACLAVLPACRKKQAEDEEPAPTSGPNEPPPAVRCEYPLFAHLDVKGIRESAPFVEVKQAIEKANLAELWEQVDASEIRELGFRPFSLDSLTFCAIEFPPRGEPKSILIVVSRRPFDKAATFDLGPQAKPDSRGVYKTLRGLVHFPDDKTAVFLHKDFVQPYLDGYAKDRSGWPLTADLTKAAIGHTAFLAVNVKKVPIDYLPKGSAAEFGPLLSARMMALTADIKGRHLDVAARATFADASTAGKAKETVQNFIKMASGFVDQFMQSKEMASLGAVKPAVEEAQRTLKDAKVDVSGSDLTLTATYKADFDVGKVMIEASKPVQYNMQRLTAHNNLRQIGLGLLNYADTYGGAIPVHGTGAKGMPLKDAKEKPLLSWRVAILPYIEQDNLYKQFKLDEPWDSESNKKLIEKMPKVFAPVAKPGKPGYTHLQMVVGPKAMPVSNVRIPASFPDGLSNTIAVVEAAEPVIWTKPADVMLPGEELPKDLKKRFGGQFPGGFTVLRWDGSTWFIRDTISDRTLGLALCPDDGEPLGSDW